MCLTTVEAPARVFHQGPSEAAQHGRLASTAVLSPSRTTKAVDDESDQERENDELENQRGA